MFRLGRNIVSERKSACYSIKAAQVPNMRVTNKMMTNNMLYNISNNKNSLSKLEDQYSSGLKIQRPSDDPIITVRALKLRTNLTELNQYYEKNIPDALSWMDVTESALKSMNDIITQVHTYCVQGANDPLKEEDRQSIVKTLAELKQQIYQEGDSNYAGRYVFTGYKTNTSLVFSEDTTNLNYSMTEIMSGKDVDIIKRTINNLDTSLYDADSPEDSDFGDKSSIVQAYRMRLAYDNVMSEEDGGEIAINFPVFDENGKHTYEDDGTLITENYTGTVVHKNSFDKGAYEPEEDEIYFLKDTGELILGSAVYADFKDINDIRITYQKGEFAKNDLRPEHYFDCTVTNTDLPDDDPVIYVKQNQEIQYEVNFNQKLVINTQGSDAIKHTIGRTIDELVNTVNDVINIQTKIDEAKKMLEETGITKAQEDKINEMIATLETEYTLKTEVMQNTFESALTIMKKQQDGVNVALADLGSRYVRLELTQNRLSTEQIDFEDLLSTNEDADLVDTIIRFKSLETIYNASLSASAKVVKNTLLDFL